MYIYRYIHRYTLYLDSILSLAFPLFPLSLPASSNHRYNSINDSRTVHMHEERGSRFKAFHIKVNNGNHQNGGTMHARMYTLASMVQDQITEIHCNVYY